MFSVGGDEGDCGFGCSMRHPGVNHNLSFARVLGLHHGRIYLVLHFRLNPADVVNPGTVDLPGPRLARGVLGREHGLNLSGFARLEGHTVGLEPDVLDVRNGILQEDIQPVSGLDGLGGPVADSIPDWEEPGWRAGGFQSPSAPRGGVGVNDAIVTVLDDYLLARNIISAVDNKDILSVKGWMLPEDFACTHPNSRNIFIIC